MVGKQGAKFFFSLAKINSLYMFEYTGTQGHTDKEALNSCQSLFYDVVRNVDKSEVATHVSVGQPGVAQTQAVQDSYL